MRKYDSPTKHKGMTIVELMVALTIGLLITAAITSLFISMRKSYKQNDSIARMQENARFAMELITQDLRHAGFFGNEADPMFIDTTRALAAATTSDDCGGTIAGGAKGIYNFASPVFLLNYGNNLTSDPATITVTVNGTSIPVYSECVAASDLNSNGSSVLLVKRSATTEPTSIVGDVVYTRATGNASQLYHQANNTTLIGGTNLEYQPHVYYIDNDSTLQRKYLKYSTGNAPVLVNEPLAEGIDAFHIEFGIDADRNGTPEYYYTPAAGSASDATIDNVVSATVYVLARTTEPDRDHLDEKTYRLGSMNVGPKNDQFHRRVYSASTSLKNIRQQVILRQGI